MSAAQCAPRHDMNQQLQPDSHAAVPTPADRAESNMQKLLSHKCVCLSLLKVSAAATACSGMVLKHTTRYDPSFPNCRIPCACCARQTQPDEEDLAPTIQNSLNMKCTFRMTPLIRHEHSVGNLSLQNYLAVCVGNDTFFISQLYNQRIILQPYEVGSSTTPSNKDSPPSSGGMAAGLSCSFVVRLRAPVSGLKLITNIVALRNTVYLSATFQHQHQHHTRGCGQKSESTIDYIQIQQQNLVSFKSGHRNKQVNR